MNISTIYRHPAELEAEAMLCREHPYPESFTFTERTTERMNRARAGLVHVMTEIAPTLDDEQSSVVNCWLSKILVLVESTSIDAEKKALASYNLSMPPAKLNRRRLFYLCGWRVGIKITAPNFHALSVPFSRCCTEFRRQWKKLKASWRAM